LSTTFVFGLVLDVPRKVGSVRYHLVRFNLNVPRIEGNITAKTMVVEEGARYNGSCQIGQAVSAAAVVVK